MEQERTFRKLALPAVAGIIVALLTLTGVTYAWFNNGNHAQVGRIHLSAEAASGLLISAKSQADWTSQLGLDAIKAAQPRDIVLPKDDTLTALSSAGDAPGGVLSLFAATLSSDASYIQNIRAASKDTDGYMKFDLYFFNQSAVDKTVSLGGTVGDAEKSTTVTGGTKDTLVQDAIRIGLIKQDSMPIGYPLVDGKNMTVSIFEPNATLHTSAGNMDYLDNVGSIPVSDLYPYVGIMGVPDSADASFNRFRSSDGVLKSVSTLKNTTDTVFTIPANAVTKVTVYIWLEGQDVDCQNSIAAGDVNIDLVFVGKPVEA